MKTQEPIEAVRPRAVKLKQAAAMLSLSENSVRRLIDRGLLKRVPGVRHVLISISVIEKFLSGDEPK